uniref:Elp3/MiaA/NifB-like radical SAM core domain-containing protein n=1 Tax=Timspurckia oligopyrenoides TaxID=708627 RepID=A0A7S1ESX6_9RHOD
MFDVKYSSPIGHVSSIELALDARKGGCDERVQKRTYRGASSRLACSTVVSELCAWENIYMIEAVRSCPEMCRFCLASYGSLPFRAADAHNELIPAIERGLKVTSRIGILGASVTQHPQWDAVVDELMNPKYDGMRLSLSSVRANTMTEKLARLLVTRDSKSVTIAVESGSQRLRDIVNKKLDDAEIIAAVENACRGGLSAMKLYGMTGIPGEKSEDLECTLRMFDELRKAVKRTQNGSFKLTFGCSTFVPKAHTPFQWFGVRPDAQKNLKVLEKRMKKIGVEFRPESYKSSLIQALLSRGDRRTRLVIELANEWGNTLGAFRRALKELRGQVPSMDHYVFDDWPLDTVLPWSHLETAISPSTILAHQGIAANQFPTDETVP